MVPRTTAAPRAATGHRVRARRPRSRPIADGDGGEATRRHRPAHRVLIRDRRRQRPHDPRAVLIDGRTPLRDGAAVFSVTTLCRDGRFARRHL